MALKDLIGDTSEIKIIDFLAENTDCSYNQSELSEFTGLSRVTINKKLPELIQNNIVEIDKEIGQVKTYKLADNNIVKLLIAAVLEHSFAQADKTMGREEELELIRKKIGSQMVYVANRYYKPPEFSYLKMEKDGEILVICEKTPMQSHEALSA